MIWNLFRRRNQELRVRLQELEEKAAAASPAYRGQYLSRAGDLCAEEGYMDRALDFWGAAIDGYLEAARPDAAAAACRKVIHHVPHVVRARRTLALLAIGHGHVPEALRQVEDYVEAARRAGRGDLAVKQLRLMARAAADPTFEARVDELLEELDARRAGRGGRPAAPEEGEGAAAGEAPAVDRQQRWDTIVRVARMSPDEIDRA